MPPHQPERAQTKFYSKPIKPPVEKKKAAQGSILAGLKSFLRKFDRACPQLATDNAMANDFAGSAVMVADRAIDATASRLNETAQNHQNAMDSQTTSVVVADRAEDSDAHVVAPSAASIDVPINALVESFESTVEASVPALIATIGTSAYDAPTIGSVVSYVAETIIGTTDAPATATRETAFSHTPILNARTAPVGNARTTGLIAAAITPSVEPTSAMVRNSFARTGNGQDPIPELIAENLTARAIAPIILANRPSRSPFLRGYATDIAVTNMVTPSRVTRNDTVSIPSNNTSPDLPRDDVSIVTTLDLDCPSTPRLQTALHLAEQRLQRLLRIAELEGAIKRLEGLLEQERGAQAEDDRENHQPVRTAVQVEARRKAEGEADVSEPDQPFRVVPFALPRLQEQQSDSSGIDIRNGDIGSSSETRGQRRRRDEDNDTEDEYDSDVRVVRRRRLDEIIPVATQATHDGHFESSAFGVHSDVAVGAPIPRPGARVAGPPPAGGRSVSFVPHSAQRNAAGAGDRSMSNTGSRNAGRTGMPSCPRSDAFAADSGFSAPVGRFTFDASGARPWWHSAGMSSSSFGLTAAPGPTAPAAPLANGVPIARPIFDGATANPGLSADASLDARYSCVPFVTPASQALYDPPAPRPFNAEPQVGDRFSMSQNGLILADVPVDWTRDHRPFHMGCGQPWEQ